MVPPKSGCGWQTTAKAVTGASAPLSGTGVSMSACRAPAGPWIIRRCACGGRRTTRDALAGRAARGGEALQQAVQALHVLGRVVQLRALRQGRLVIEQLRELGEFARLRHALEVLHQRVRAVELQQRVCLGGLLAGGREDAPHLLPEIVLAEHQA